MSGCGGANDHIGIPSGRTTLRRQLSETMSKNAQLEMANKNLWRHLEEAKAEIARLHAERKATR